MNTSSLGTKHLLLIPYSEAYLHDLYHLLQKNKTRLSHSFPQMLSKTETLEDTYNFIEAKINDRRNKRAYPFLIMEKESHKLIGHCNLKDIDESVPKAELAYWIDQGFEGKGLATEAVSALIKFGFEELKMLRIFARIVSFNSGSGRVLEKCGLEKEGLMRKEYRTYAGEIVDTYMYAIINTNL